MGKLEINKDSYRGKALQACLDENNVTLGDLGDILFCAKNTARSRMNSPGTISVDELNTLARAWGWTDSQIASFVRNKESAIAAYQRSARHERTK